MDWRKGDLWRIVFKKFRMSWYFNQCLDFYWLPFQRCINDSVSVLVRGHVTNLAVKQTSKHPRWMKLSGPNLLGLRNLSSLWPTRGTIPGSVWAISRQFFSHNYNTFACRCLKWPKFSLKSHACQREENSVMLSLGPYYGHVWAILGPCFGYFYNIFASKFL